MKRSLFLFSAVIASIVACEPSAPSAESTAAVQQEPHERLGYASEAAWGEHLIAATGCDDCHSPKMMTAQGPVPDPALRLSGFRAEVGVPPLDRKVIEANGAAACNSDLTAWIGPWGISYAANLTSSETGIGNWTKEQFFKAIREGKIKGLDGGRMILPPMPWPNYAKFTDAELSAMFAYLQTVPAVDNVVPPPTPPVAAAQ